MWLSLCSHGKGPQCVEGNGDGYLVKKGEEPKPVSLLRDSSAEGQSYAE